MIEERAARLAGLVTLARHESNSRQQLAQATDALEQRAAHQLQAVSVTRRNDIVHYFESVEGVVRATAARRDVLDQVVALTDGITRLADGVDLQLEVLTSDPASAEAMAREAQGLVDGFRPMIPPALVRIVNDMSVVHEGDAMQIGLSITGQEWDALLSL